MNQSYLKRLLCVAMFITSQMIRDGKTSNSGAYFEFAWLNFAKCSSVGLWAPKVNSKAIPNADFQSYTVSVPQVQN